jgi:hypothetical protein
MVGQSSFHCWRYPQAFVYPAEIVIREVQALFSIVTLGHYRKSPSPDLCQAFDIMNPQPRVRLLRATPARRGEVREWLKRSASKADIPERVSGVQIPPSPPDFLIQRFTGSATNAGYQIR